eukprot:sb/3472077/
MSNGSACSFKDRLKVYSDERVLRSVYGEVQGEVFDLLKDLFTLAGMKDTFPKSLTAGRGAWDGVKCLTKSQIKGIKKADMDVFTEKVCHLLMERCYPALDRLSYEVEETERKLLDTGEDLWDSRRKGGGSVTCERQCVLNWTLGHQSTGLLIWTKNIVFTLYSRYVSNGEPL